MSDDDARPIGNPDMAKLPISGFAAGTALCMLPARPIPPCIPTGTLMLGTAGRAFIIGPGIGERYGIVAWAALPMKGVDASWFIDGALLLCLPAMDRLSILMFRAPTLLHVLPVLTPAPLLCVQKKQKTKKQTKETINSTIQQHTWEQCEPRLRLLEKI